jgi:hypothetical protein
MFKFVTISATPFFFFFSLSIAEETGKCKTATRAEEEGRCM